MRIEDTDPARHAGIEYPMEVGAPVFAPIKVTEEKDKAVNVARQNAKLEYDRIMEQAEVLMKQAKALQARLDATEMVHSAKFGFNPIHGKIYHLYFDGRNNTNVLIQNGPKEWSCGIPDGWTYSMAVKKLGDSTWAVIEEDSVGALTV
ncbi:MULTISPECIES: DUF2452 domain-containing protein [unclassified Polynucleobacter]|uniref:DUF2452 domain-containing protein n=1 Tax=unclassified Polynucleobacter TaxID=2640945 RepID=UPI001BFE23CC|nr:MULTISPECIES: DUF2452 domain-containing protein [unclassified Polynucleobacter]MBU3639956.1 DUF2452 domain-containing protein [Polynucleobacter sp. AP-RePozz3-80-G7]MEA9601969.1 DUF2452 domain-containing protein [Polynucleobacter sp. MG-28-Ekke-A2]QWD81187.1 DUF2452 domain-containing protein [Polynucleobacter sp. MWH-S4W17]